MEVQPSWWGQTSGPGVRGPTPAQWASHQAPHCWVGLYWQNFQEAPEVREMSPFLHSLSPFSSFLLKNNCEGKAAGGLCSILISRGSGGSAGGPGPSVGLPPPLHGFSLLSQPLPSPLCLAVLLSLPSPSCSAPSSPPFFGPQEPPPPRPLPTFPSKPHTLCC